MKIQFDIVVVHNPCTFQVPYFVCPIEYSTELEQMTMSCEPSHLFRQQVRFFQLRPFLETLIFPGVAIALPDFAHLGANSDQQGDPCHLSLLPPRLLDVTICLYHWTLWRLLCVRLQEGIQDQGFWRYHTWTWWYYGQV